MRRGGKGPNYARQTNQGTLPPRFDNQPWTASALAANQFDLRASSSSHGTMPVGSPSEASLTAQMRFAETENQLSLTAPGPMLLDVSTARHQIGVKISAFGRDRPDGALTSFQPAVDRFVVWGSRLGATLSQLQVFALPQIQWEPVRTLEKDQDPVTLGLFPTPLASPDDGGATVIGSDTAGAAPVIPDLALTKMRWEAFDSGQPFGMVTTLPFGIKTLFRVRSNATATRLPDTAEYVRPKFDGPNALEGGLQLSVRSEGGAEKPGRKAPPSRG